MTWRLAVGATGEARFAAAVFGPRGKRRLAAGGKLAAGKVTAIRFLRRHLRSGRYHAVVTVVGSPAARLRSRTFEVLIRSGSLTVARADWSRD